MMELPTEKTKLLFLVPVWGRAYTQLFLDICLPLILTEGNLGHFRDRKDVRFLVQTTYDGMVAISASPSWTRLQELVSAEFIVIDGIVDLTSPHHTMSDCYRLGMSSPFVTPGYTCFVFLTPDSFWSDGTFRRIDELIDEGYNAAMIAGLRTDLEKLKPFLAEEIAKHPDNPVISNRTLVSKALAALHPMALPQNWTSRNFINAWPSQIYWRAGADSIIYHCFHMHPLFLKSPKKSVNFKTTVDGDFIAKTGYPLSSFYIVTNSDEMTGVELSSPDRSWGQPLELPQLSSVISFSFRHANKFHWHFFRHRLFFRGESPSSFLHAIEPNVKFVVEQILKRARVAALVRLFPDIAIAGWAHVRRMIRKFVARAARVTRRYLHLPPKQQPSAMTQFDDMARDTGFSQLNTTQASRISIEPSIHSDRSYNVKKADDGYQNVANFVLNGRDMANWSEAKAAPYITELMNKEAYRFMKNAFGYLLGSGVSGDYHEYGCFSARTFRMALTEAKKYRIDDMYFYAADSFEGLPEPTNAPAVEAWSKGAMAMSEKEFLDLIRQHGVNVDKIRTIKGFFSDSLTPALQRELLDKGRKIAILNVDCDLKEAAADVFRFVAPLVQEGTLVYLDDFFAGYHGKITAGTGGAFFEFAEEHGWKYEIFANVGFWGRAYIIYR